MTESSPFFDVPRSEWLASNVSAFAITDRFPVSPGHSLVVPRRELASWWELSTDERIHIWELVDEVKSLLVARHAPSGFNVGFDEGAAAGRTIGHVHIHVVPRYEGDVPGPPLGLRGVIPVPQSTLQTEAAQSVELIDSLDERTLKLALLRCLINDAYDRIDILVSFIMRSGLEIVERRLAGALERGAHIRVLTTDYMSVTHPDALTRLLDLSRTGRNDDAAGTITTRVFRDPTTSFHPKAYLFFSSVDARGTAFVGSNNLSRSGIETGIEWSLQTTDLAALRAAFHRLWQDPRTQTVTDAWLAGYRAQFNETQPVVSETSAEAARASDAESAAEPVLRPPEPRPIQEEALRALEATRQEGHKAGLVVLATGLGKTWLAAFDSSRREFPRVLFVAHRDEILSQSRDVFRRVRPDARLGFFTGAEKTADADVVFASVQTLQRHLSSFGPGDFEYVVVDEFHHASAGTYRRVINHFEPRFLLGLTATPDRLDGADLLALCGDNLVYRCDLAEGIERDELAPFHYWGVADTVDFAPIPWRNGRFDPEALDNAVTTKERADAALRELRRRGGDRTLAFCASIRHADYMANHFNENGFPAVSLHSQSEFGLRARAIEQLESGEIKVLVTVDLFNEGVDVPTIDTVLMLRPTESPVLFLQQLGRGLRVALGKSHLEVVDFVGNHRSFLAPLRTLIALRLGHAPTNSELLAALRDKTFVLPSECSIDYSLEALDLLASVIRAHRAGATDVLRELCLQLADEEGIRPSALQVAIAGGNVRAAKQRAGGWFELLRDLDLLVPEESAVLDAAAEFLQEVATTAVTRSFKMVLLQALLHDGQLRTGMRAGDLAARSLKLVQVDPRLAADVDRTEFPTIHVVESAKWERYWSRNPVAAWTGGRWFTLSDDGRFLPRFHVPDELGETFDAMVAELVEWRLHDYFLRGRGQAMQTDSIVLRVSHAGGSPIIRLDRAKAPSTPEGVVEFTADGETYVGRFVKVALNTATRGDVEGNALPALLRRWFGPSAGHPGSDHRVVLRDTPSGWALAPAGRAVGEGEGTTLPFFPDYAVACGAFATAVPADAALKRQSVVGLTDVGPDDFLVIVRGESMAGGETDLHHGDLVRMRWTRRRTPDELLGRPVLVELVEGGDRRPALKLLDRDADGFVLRSTAEGYDDIRATRQMTVVGELVELVDPNAWNPISQWLGKDFRREAVPALFGEEFNFGKWGQSGHVTLENDSVLFVTLEKEEGRSGADYVDYFASPSVFHWTSQSTTAPEGKKGREILEALDTGRRIHLFARKRRQEVAFAYCGTLVPTKHEGAKPMIVWFRVVMPLDRDLCRRFGVSGS